MVISFSTLLSLYIFIESILLKKACIIQSSRHPADKSRIPHLKSQIFFFHFRSVLCFGSIQFNSTTRFSLINTTDV